MTIKLSRGNKTRKVTNKSFENHLPDDQNTDSSRNVGSLAHQLPDAAASPTKFRLVTMKHSDNTILLRNAHPYYTTTTANEHEHYW